MTEDDRIFHGFVFAGESYEQERIEQAARAVQPRLSSAERRRVNDALLARLDDAKRDRCTMSRIEMLSDPAVSTLVNTLALVNQAWIASVIAKNIRGRSHLRGASVKELFSTALTGEGAVGGVMNAILAYDYARHGVDAFSPYLTRTVRNALLPTSKQKQTYRRIGSRTQPLGEGGEGSAEMSWEDRTAPRPENVAIEHEMLEVVQNVIPHLPTQQQRETAAWMIERILATGQLPMIREAAAIQRPPVTGERGRQIMIETVNNIRNQIEKRYPHLAEHGVNGWREFKETFTRTRVAAQNSGMGDGRVRREI